MEEKDPYIVEKPTGLDAFLKDLESNPFKPAPYPFQTNFSDQAIAEPTTAEPFDFSKVNNTENSENNISNAFRSAAKGKDKLQAEYADSNIFKRFNNREVSVQDLGIDQDQLEYKYANTQSFLERSMNDIRAGGANAGATFVAGFLALPDIFNTIKNGGEFTPSESVIAVDAWRKEVEENNTNFKTAIDDETGVYNTLKNILLPGFMTGSSKGWGELFRSTMYGVGAGAAFAVQQGIASLIPGVGNTAVAAYTVARILNATKNFGQMVKLGDTVLKTSLGFNRLKNSLIVADKLTDATKWTYRASIGSYGEAAFEGLESRHVLKETLIDNFRAKHGYAPSASQLKEIEKTANDASNARFLGNMALLGVTQTYQLNRLFKQFDLAKETYDEIAKRGKKLGLDQAGAPVVKELLDATKWYNRGVGKFAKDGSRRIVETFTEGAEEFTQGVIADATDRYYTYKIDHRGRADINDAFRATKEGFKDNLNTEGLRNFVTGAFAGYAQSILFELGGKGYQKAAGTYKNEKDIQDKALEESISYAEDFDFKTQVAAFNVNSVRGTLTDRYMNANAASVGQMESDKALQANDKKVFKDIGTRTFFNSVESYIKRGHGDLLKEQMKFATDKHEGNISELFQSLSKSEFLLKYDSEIDKANLAYSSVVKAFKSPYKQGSSLDNAFNNVWVPEMAFMNYRLNDLVSRKESLQQELGLYFDEYKHFLTKDTFKEGMSHLKKRITQIQDGTSDVDLREKYIKAQSLFYNFNDLVRSSQSTSQQIQDKFLEFHDLYGDITNQYLNNAYDSFDLAQKDEVFNKTNDTVLIANDIDKIKLGLKGYYKKDAFAMFIARYAKDYIAEAKKAKKAEKIEDKGGVEAVQKKVEDLRDKTDIGPEEAEYIILNTETDEEATKQAEELRQQEIIKVKLQSDKIRLVNDKFLIAGISDATSKFLQYNLAINDETVSVEDFEKIVDGFIKDSISQTTEEKVDKEEEPILTIKEEEEIVIKEVEILDELEESTLVSKFENRSFDPDVFNAEGLVRQEILDQFQTLKDYQDFIKSEAYNLIKHLVDNEKMSEQQLMAHILENSTLKYYTVDDAGENDIKIHKPYTVSRLAQEKVLRSETVNVVTLEYFDKSTGTNIFLQSYKEPFKSITFLTSNELVSVFEEAQTEIDAEIQSKINSVIGNDNISYYDFLKKVVQDEDARDVYNFLVEKKFLKFTTSPQNQLNLLKEKQKEWEALRDLRFQPLEGNVSFERHYIGFKSQPKFITRISDISHPYVQITDPQSGITRNKYVFFNYNKSLDGENQIKFIPAQTKDSADLRALIAKSFEAKSEKKGESLNGYYMLVSDSKQNKLAMGDDGKVHSFTIRLRGKKLVKIDPNTQLPEIDLATNESTIDWQQFIDTFKGTESNTVALVDYNFNGFSATLSRSIFENKPWDGKNVQLELDFQEGTREFRFTTVNFNLNDIEKTLANLSSAKTIQFEDKANTSTKKAFTDVKLNLVPVVSTGKEPTSAEDMMNTREAVGVGKENFLVSKFKPIFVVKEETQPVPFEAEFKQEKKDTRRDDIEREKQEELDKLKQGIPTMITQALRANLRQYFTDEQISHMTPIVANNNYIEAKYAEKLAALSVNDVINKPIEIQHISDEAISDMTQIIVAQTGYTNEEHIQAFIISAAVGYRNYRRTTNARTANDFEISLNPDFNVINKFLTKIYATQTFEKAKDLTSTAFTKNGNINFNLFTGSTPTLRVDESIEVQVQQLIIQCP